jgi:thioredoxin reductase (NADPH)
MLQRCIFLFFLLIFFLARGLVADQERSKSHDCVIIGGGIGGGTAAIYLSRAGFRPIVIERAPVGGALAQSEAIENWPGMMQIRGIELMERVRQQAIANGATYVNGEVTGVDFSRKPFVISYHRQDANKTIATIQARCCVIATGASPKNLRIPGEKEYWTKGISNCAVCDGSLYKDKAVAVIGGGDTAVLEALYLSKIAKDVTVFVRGNALKGTDIKKKEVLLATPNVHILYQSELQAFKGNGRHLTGAVVLQDKTGLREVELDGVFLALGSEPSTAIFKGQVEMDSKGYILLKKSQQTSVDGVYAIGDAVDPFYKQAISAAGDGAKAALAMIQNDLSGVASVAMVNEGEPAVSRQRSLKILEIESVAQFENEIKAARLPVIVDFYTSRCGPCQRIAPHIEEAASQLQGKVLFLKVNADRVSGLAKKYEISSVPMAVFMNRDGAVQEKRSGEQEVNELLTRVRQM